MGTKIINIALLFAFLSACNSDFKEAAQVSLNVQEAKEKKVFVFQYKIQNINILESNYNFPIRNIWEEKPWHLVLDKHGNETFRIDDSSAHRLVLQLNSKDSFITESNFTNGKWVLRIDNTEIFCGSTRGMINLNLHDNTVNDIATLTIYKLNESNNYKTNLDTIIKFEIAR